jgi:tetratricopeptide (TPR) repeat protein
MNTLRIASALLALLCSAAALAQTSSYGNRAEALKGLTASEPARRADAVIWIANNGQPADEAALRKRLTDDDSPIVRGLAEQGVWTLWSRSGDDAIDQLMAKGAERIEAGELDDAIAIYSEVIKRKPAFVEGWNKRATVLFLSGDYKRSLADCDQVMKRNPNHFGALAGYGQIYFRLERYEKAISYWKRARQVNPNMTGVADGIEMAEKLLAAQRRNTT